VAFCPYTTVNTQISADTLSANKDRHQTGQSWAVVKFNHTK